jgi:hypothetical protein
MYERRIVKDKSGFYVLDVVLKLFLGTVPVPGISSWGLLCSALHVLRSALRSPFDRSFSFTDFMQGLEH